MELAILSANVAISGHSEQNIIDGFYKDCKIQGLSDTTCNSYLYNLRRFHKWTVSNKIDIVNINKIQLRDYVEYMRFEVKAQYKTLKNNLSALSSFYNYLCFEDKIKSNPVIPIRKRYIHNFKNQDKPGERQLISIKQMSEFIKSILDVRDKALVLLFAKTGIRRGELINIDEEDINWRTLSINLKPRAKRTNCKVFFDEETAYAISAWRKHRNSLRPKTKALFIGQQHKRLSRHGIGDLFTKWAEAYGIHNPDSKKMVDHFTPHCCRHWFTTHLRRAGMSREFIQELRGDARKDAIDIYDHIDPDELRIDYLDKIPQLSV